MKMLLGVSAVIGMLVTGLATVVMIVFCMGMGANASPSQLRALKLWKLALSSLGLVGVIIGIVLLHSGHPGWAAGVSVFPAAAMGLILLITLLKQ